jgi:aspartyl-tRNA(Asn)/glutamyl-tRNA(Gln) amidotransferase subunit C
MSLQISDVNRLAHLARLHLNPQEADIMLVELNGIFGMIEQLQAVTTTGLEPMSHPLGGAQRMRADGVTETPDREANMHNAPLQQDGLFLVPKVIE